MRPSFRIALFATLAVVVAHLADSWAWLHVVRLDVYEHDFGRMWRIFGYLPFWLIVAVAVWAQTRNRRAALLLALVPTAGGALAALLQVLLRRERPGLHDGHYVFRAFNDRPLHGAEFGLPSSHAMVAFSAAWLLCRMYPRAWPVWVVIATGCALSRVAAQAHFLSDVTVAAVAAYFLVAVVWRRIEPSGLRPEGLSREP
jgi:membrane-associated phospholipid phosphatase